MFVFKHVPVCNFILLIFACASFEKDACAFIGYVGKSGFS